MHHMSKSQPNNGQTPIQSVFITAIALFALSGAILGFTVGIFTRHLQQNPQQPSITQQSSDARSLTPAATTTQIPTPTITPTVVAQPLGFPQVGVANLSTPNSYTVTVQAVGKSSTNNSPKITADGISCRIWLVKSNHKPTVDANALKKSFSNFSNISTYPNEIAGGLIFDPTTPQQVQTTTGGTGLATWKVSLASNLSKGYYYIGGITDWNGTYYNFSWQSIYKAS
jgi:hypothetical protein